VVGLAGTDAGLKLPMEIEWNFLRRLTHKMRLATASHRKVVSRERTPNAAARCYRRYFRGESISTLGKYV